MRSPIPSRIPADRRAATGTPSSPLVSPSHWGVIALFASTIVPGCNKPADYSNPSYTNPSAQFRWPNDIEHASSPYHGHAGTLALVHFRKPTDSPRTALLSQEPTPNPPKASVNVITPPERATIQISAQGRLQPLGGIVPLSSLPGDRIASIDVEVGQTIQVGERLITLESEQAKRLEIDGVSLKIADVRAQHQAQLRDAELAVSTSQAKQVAASQQRTQAIAASARVQEQREWIASLERHVQTLERLRDDPLTKPAIGSLELDSKRNELRTAVQSLAQAELTSKHAIEASELAIQQAIELNRSATASREALLAANPVATLEKQIELLQLQLKQSSIHSPLNGTVIQIIGSPGERTATMPLIQIADLSKMACVAEIHEADIANVSPGQRVEMKSSALARPIQGKVIRIDRSIGSAQMRSPNPLSRSDFRSVPVWIEIDSADTPLASERLQLQVDTVIFANAARNKLDSSSSLR